MVFSWTRYHRDRHGPGSGNHDYAVIITYIVMYVASGTVERFVGEHPTTKLLSLAFLLLIGVALLSYGFKFHIPRGYIYFVIAFSAAVEFFNVLAKRNRKKRTLTN
jgi:predicted tellurium resistance membrane protein TerC